MASDYYLFYFLPTADSIARTGAKSVVVNIDPVTFISIRRKLKQLLLREQRKPFLFIYTSKWRIMEPIVEIDQKYHLAIIEDATQAIGAKYKWKPVGEMGTAATYKKCQKKLIEC
ncbi:DegT/DnrJ/EryC1/StrS family aminotransferase [Bacillus methanolicus]|uniref:DegT/DnrJ/EryC1/StrS family aminotransferase n=1 Tax=Bacillus methanolicus TaxID=1471 RepID=UPI0023806B10|nr:DegT/DnrJ/EryC1/StrS family aminotransferase [Bacillus methanolicus]